MQIVHTQHEKEGKLLGRRFLRSTKGHLIRLNKHDVKYLVQNRLRMAQEANRETTVNNVVEALFSPATYSYA